VSESPEGGVPTQGPVATQEKSDVIFTLMFGLPLPPVRIQ